MLHTPTHTHTQNPQTETTVLLHCYDQLKGYEQRVPIVLVVP